MKRRSFLINCSAISLVSTVSPRVAFTASNPTLLTSFSILQDIVRQIAPPHFSVETLVPANSDAHVFNPKPGDARLVRDADLIFFNGLGFEGWLTRLTQAAGYKGKTIQTSTTISARKTAGQIDPHAWQNLANGVAYAQVIRDALLAHYPEYRSEITSKSQLYIDLLKTTHDSIVASFSKIPVNQRKIVTSHDAFSYFGEAYGLEFMAPQGWSTHSAPSAASIARLIRQIKRQNIKAVFLENISDSRQIEQIARETGAKLGGTLYSDALSETGGAAATYLDMFKHNSSTILNALLS